MTLSRPSVWDKADVVWCLLSLLLVFKSNQQMDMNMSSGSLILSNVLLEQSSHSLTLTKASMDALVKHKT